MKSVGISAAPDDPRHFVYLIFYWLGIGTLLPWNFFISVPGYWNAKWETVVAADAKNATDGGGSGSDASDNGTNDTISGNATSAATDASNDMQTAWNGHLAVASMVPNVTFLLLNAAFGHRFRTQPRLIVSLCLVILLFVFTDVMAWADTDSWQKTFYVVTLVSVVCININSAIFQGGLLGIAGKFPPKYMGAVFSGQALGGIFASATNIVFLALGSGAVDAAFYSFLIAVLFLTTALAGYITVTRSDFFKFYLAEKDPSSDDPTAEEKTPMEVMRGQGGLGDNKQTNDGIEPDYPVRVQLPTRKPNPLRILGSIWPYALSIFLIFFVTLGCFPAITVLVRSTGKSSTWTETYFTPVTCFLLFNVGDYLGRTLAEYIRRPRGPSPAGAATVLALSVARLAFVAVFVLCNANPGKRSLAPILIYSDAGYIAAMLLFSLSNGYLGCVCMMVAPQAAGAAAGRESVDPAAAAKAQETAASLMVALLGLGLGTGSAFSNVFLKLR